MLVDLEVLCQSAALASSEPFPGGTLVRVVPFAGEYQIRTGQLFGSGLDGRLYTDISNLSAGSLITPTDKFYIRTACPDLIDYSTPWTIKVTPATGAPLVVPMDKVESMSKDMGIHLMECSGNDRGGQYTLMSACRWDGVPLLHLLKSVKFPAFQRLCVSGFDQYSKPSGTPGLVHSEPGASWIFTRDQLESSGAFLATKMNGEALPKDHGYPVRLVVPGWYGCTCIKWVNEIFAVDDNAPATSQMQEFAGRTHQDGIPQLASEFKPASIDQSAMPIRVEEWRVNGRIRYNVVGIMWGGNRPTRKLQIRFLPDETYMPVEDYHQSTNATWILWSYKWDPPATGTFKMQMRIDDPTIQTRRLDKGYYTRSVDIPEV